MTQVWGKTAAPGYQNEIEDPLAEQILQGKAGQGSRVKVTVKDGKLHFGLKRGLNK